jgi:hypothetical protein
MSARFVTIDRETPLLFPEDLRKRRKKGKKKPVEREPKRERAGKR